MGLLSSLLEQAGFQPNELYTTFLEARGKIINESRFQVKKIQGRGYQAGDEMGAMAGGGRGLGSILL